eukprot:scaffold3606_cov188-Prasinococcus_capsulatus_cf.AAC.2
MARLPSWAQDRMAWAGVGWRATPSFVGGGRLRRRAPGVPRPRVEPAGLTCTGRDDVGRRDEAPP